ncbi:hypothetical protein [Bacillus phage Hakuna]|uniref:Uncharacterized protein n=2 Tax=Wphvirus TaxID=1922327 RepID=A0A024B224_9CAUD|nr:hypothetical protein FP72_gp183 [Bacillus phage Hakuna]YP_009280991.1 hypothetical protein SAGEFAYGE_188 [Bacillus phage SageFayge]AOZ61811.1 hypothetical protein BJ4_188 [Bacillus phage BJ4]QDH49463.1 hypothetical protein PHIREBALL_189 [Bacillus phage Phireball]QDH50171.1 hypothetical protein ALPS_185 [Bacillus phage ALPS]ULF49098.1 hypothetical protein [Bacillus phage Darren]ULF49394.1 hypothetical protein [Bacillus phage MrBubbles]
MYDGWSDEKVLKVYRDFKAAFLDDSPWNMINRAHFFQCMKAAEEELIKRGVLMNEED